MEAALAAAPPRARVDHRSPLQNRTLAAAVLLHALLFLAFLLRWPPGEREALSPVELPRDVIKVTVVSRSSLAPDAVPSTQAPPPQAAASEARSSVPEAQAEPSKAEVEPPARSEVSERKREDTPEPRAVTEVRTPPEPAAASSQPTPFPPAAQGRVGSKAAPAPADTRRPSRATEVRPFPLGYLRVVSRRIQLNLNYPSWSRRFHEQGTVIVRLRIARDGQVLAADVVRGSNSQYLDAEARDVMLRIARFPRIPGDVYPEQSDFLIDQPVRFMLE